MTNKEAMTSKKAIAYILMIVAGLILFGFFIYGCYWVAKTVSYSIFYEDMVVETVKELVRENCLR
jgi:hypothetical protein